MLKCKKTVENLKATKEEELVFKDYQGEKIQKFNTEHTKLMDISDGEDLTEKYTGKHAIEPTQSMGKLAKILQYYRDREENG